MAKWLEDISVFTNLDCGSSSCKYSITRGGMRVNGPCRCAENHPRDVEVFLMRNYHKALLKVQQLEATLEVDKLLEGK